MKKHKIAVALLCVFFFTAAWAAVAVAQGERPLPGPEFGLAEPYEGWQPWHNTYEPWLFHWPLPPLFTDDGPLPLPVIGVIERPPIVDPGPIRPIEFPPLIQPDPLPVPPPPPVVKPNPLPVPPPPPVVKPNPLPVPPPPPVVKPDPLPVPPPPRVVEPRHSAAGFGPFFQRTGAGSSWSQTPFVIGGTAPTQVVYDPIAGDSYVLGEYSQFYVIGAGEGQPAGPPTVFNGPSLTLDADSTFAWAQLAAGDTLLLITTGPGNVKIGPKLRSFAQGRIQYGPDFATDLQEALDLIEPFLAPRLTWDTPYLGEYELYLRVVTEPGMLRPSSLAMACAADGWRANTSLSLSVPAFSWAPPAYVPQSRLTVVPEPGTVVLLMTGGLGLLLLVWRRKPTPMCDKL